MQGLERIFEQSDNLCKNTLTSMVFQRLNKSSTMRFVISICRDLITGQRKKIGNGLKSNPLSALID